MSRLGIVALEIFVVGIVVSGIIARRVGTSFSSANVSRFPCRRAKRRWFICVIAEQLLN
jgi:hypothetical protein